MNPLSTAVMWGRSGAWCPQGNSDETFVTTLENICRGWSLVANYLRTDPRTLLVQAEPIEFHGTWHHGHTDWDQKSQEWSEFCNARALLATDLALGQVQSRHPLRGYLQSHGMSQANLDWFETNPAPVDVLGWDYYAHTSEHFWHSGAPGWERPGPRPLGMFEMFKRQVERFPGHDVMLGETNIPGRVEDRITWLRYVTSEAVRLQRWLVDSGRSERFVGLCWFPSFDSHSWKEAEMARVTDFDPNGIWWIDRELRRHDSELSRLWSQLAQGKAGYQDLPVYPFNPELAHDLAGFRDLMPLGVFPEQHSVRDKSDQWSWMTNAAMTC